MTRLALGVCMLGTIFAVAVVLAVSLPIPYGLFLFGPALGLMVLVAHFMEPR